MDAAARDLHSAVLLDLDGTLWDATSSIVRVWNRILAREGIPVRITEEGLRAATGKPWEEIGRALLGPLPPAERAAVLNLCGQEEVAFLREHGGVLYAGVADTLRSLRSRWRVAMVSNCQRGYAYAFLHAHGLAGLLDDVVEAGETGLSKGQNILRLMQRSGIDHAVYVGDTAGDLSAAREARLPFIHAAYGFGSVPEADAVIASFPDLPPVVSSLLG